MKLRALTCVAVLAAIGGAAYLHHLPLAVFWLYCTASLIATLLYACDKHAAIAGNWRIKESILHGVALLGGWPGALAAQGLLRHKVSKRSFQRIFWLTVAVNCSVLGWYALASVPPTQDHKRTP